MTLTQLKYMIAVAETGNFTSASKSFCHTALPKYANSKTEDELGVQILTGLKSR